MFKHPTDRKTRKTSRNFVAPTKEQATTGYFMQAGDSHGVGFRTPVGTHKASSYESGPVPLKSKCFLPSDAIQ